MTQLPQKLFLDPETFFEILFLHKSSTDTESAINSKKNLKNDFLYQRVPSKVTWLTCLVDRWNYIRKNDKKENLQTFFQIDEKVAEEYLANLATKLHNACESISSLQIGSIYKHIKSEKSEEEKEKLFFELDSTTDKKHWNLLLTSEFLIEDIYIDPLFKVYSSKVGEVYPVECCNEFIDESENILKEQKNIFVIGKYGSGKTIVSKKIQLHFSKKGWNCYFVKSSRIDEDIINSIDRCITELSAKVDNILIIFDSLEDLYNPKISESKLFHDIIKRTIKISRLSKNVHFLFNTRFLGKTDEDTFKVLSEAYFDKEIYELKFVVLGEFDKPKQADWLDSIANAQAKIQNKEERIYSKELKHHGLIGACKNPLFLYKVSDFFYEDEEKLLTKTYFIYKQFVDKTVKGRYQDENPYGSKSIQDITENYKLFLRFAAKEIAKKITIFNQNVKSSDEIGLDPNFDQYTISHDILSLRAVDLIEKEISYLHEIDQARMITNMMSCYFFEHVKSTDSWKFRDNNIIYFLIAEDIFETIKAVFAANNATETIYEELLSCLNVFFHPFIIDLLVNRIRYEDQEAIGWISAHLESMIKNGIILEFQKHDGVFLPIQKIRIDAILGIIFIQVNKSFYYSFPLILNNLMVLAQLAHPIDISAFNAIRRSFRDAVLDGIKLQHQDLDGYNLSGSSLRNALIEKCHIDDFMLTNTVLENTTFRNCHIEFLNLHNSSGTIFFERCTISNINATNCQLDTIKFSECTIDILNIIFDKNHSRPFVYFVKSILDHVVIGHAKEINIFNSIHSKECNFDERNTKVKRVNSNIWS